MSLCSYVLVKIRRKDKHYFSPTVRICLEVSASVRICPYKVSKLLDYIRKNAYLCSEKKHKDQTKNQPLMIPKFYYKSELAQAYFSESACAIESSVHRLTRWIRNNTPLYEALLAVGYRPQQKHYTRAQTALIFEYLGEP